MEIITGFLRRRYRIILIALLLSLPFAALYLFLAPATYTASAHDDDRAAEGPIADLWRAAIHQLMPVGSKVKLAVLKSQNVAAVCGQTAAPC